MDRKIGSFFSYFIVQSAGDQILLLTFRYHYSCCQLEYKSVWNIYASTWKSIVRQIPEICHEGNLKVRHSF